MGDKQIRRLDPFVAGRRKAGKVDGIAVPVIVGS